MSKQLTVAFTLFIGLSACAPSLQSSLPDPSAQASITPTVLPSLLPSPEPSSAPNHPCPTLFKTPQNLDLPIEKVKLTHKDSGEALSFKPQGICNSPDGHTLYVLDDDQVWVTDAQTLQATPLFETAPQFVRGLISCVRDTQNHLYLNNRFYSPASKDSRLYRYHLKEKNFVFLDQGENESLSTSLPMAMSPQEDLFIVGGSTVKYLDKELKAQTLEADYGRVRDSRIHVSPGARERLENALNGNIKDFPLGDITAIGFAHNKMYLADQKWHEIFIVDESNQVTVLPTLEGRSLSEPNKIIAVFADKLLHEPKRDIFLTLAGTMGWFSPHEGCHQDLNTENATETYKDFTLSYDDYVYMVSPSHGVARIKIPEDLGKTTQK